MAVVTREALLEKLKAKFGDDTSDETISIIEDVTDTFTDYETRVSDSTDWKTKYEENDRSWRERYTNRFFNGAESGGEYQKEDQTEYAEREVETEDKKTKFEELFDIKEG